MTRKCSSEFRLQAAFRNGEKKSPLKGELRTELQTFMNTFRQWIQTEIHAVLSKNGPTVPFLLWLDPAREWQVLLQLASHESFELWEAEGHELLLRHRFAIEDRRPVVIWLPKRREELTFFKVFEAEASVREISLLQGLREYGVEITHAREDDLLPVLQSYARELIDEPLPGWKRITGAGSEIVTDQLILECLASWGKPFKQTIHADKWDIFLRRIVGDFGFPEPDPEKPDP